MISFRICIVLISCTVLFITGCDDGSGPVSTALPRGSWYRVVESDAGGQMTRTHSRITITHDSASVVDTIFTVVNNVSSIDSIRFMELELNGIGDGYYRALEIHTTPDLIPIDTTLHYWYFFIENDSLYHFTGMRFIGNHAGIVGSWGNDRDDNVLLGEHGTMAFTPDSVMIVRAALDGSTLFAKQYPYETERDTLKIAGNDVPYYGRRYEVVPGLALYITAHANRGYAPLEE